MQSATDALRSMEMSPNHGQLPSVYLQNISNSNDQTNSILHTQLEPDENSPGPIPQSRSDEMDSESPMPLMKSESNSSMSPSLTKVAGKNKKSKKKYEDDEEFFPAKKTSKSAKKLSTPPLRSYSSSTAKKQPKQHHNPGAPSMNALALSYMGPPTDGYNDYSHVKGVYKNCRGIWAAQWTDEKGQRHTKYFNPKFFPTENEARISALKFKQDVMQEIELKGGPRKQRTPRAPAQRYDYNSFYNGAMADPLMYQQLMRQQQAAYQMSWAMASQQNMMPSVPPSGSSWAHMAQTNPEYAQYMQAYESYQMQSMSPEMQAAFAAAASNASMMGQDGSEVKGESSNGDPGSYQDGVMGIEGMDAQESDGLNSNMDGQSCTDQDMMQANVPDRH